MPVVFARMSITRLNKLARLKGTYRFAHRAARAHVDLDAPLLERIDRPRPQARAEYYPSTCPRYEGRYITCTAEMLTRIRHHAHLVADEIYHGK